LPACAFDFLGLYRVVRPCLRTVKAVLNTNSRCYSYQAVTPNPNPKPSPP